jgi:hypothetical protein
MKTRGIQKSNRRKSKVALKKKRKFQKSQKQTDNGPKANHDKSASSQPTGKEN